jgi:hypothetical protein
MIVKNCKTPPTSHNEAVGNVFSKILGVISTLLYVIFKAVSEHIFNAVHKKGLFRQSQQTVTARRPVRVVQVPCC